MENFVYYNNLFDIYGSLLTSKEAITFQDYYQEDLSLSEIADNNNISRSAVQKTIKTVLDKLNNYEEKLHIYKDKSKLNEIVTYDDINKIKEEINDLLSA